MGKHDKSKIAEAPDVVAPPPVEPHMSMQQKIGWTLLAVSVVALGGRFVAEKVEGADNQQERALWTTAAAFFGVLLLNLLMSFVWNDPQAQQAQRQAELQQQEAEAAAAAAAAAAPASTASAGRRRRRA